MRKSLIAAVAALPLLAFLSAVHAQSAAAPQPTAAQQELIQIKQKIDSLQAQVSAIQRKALEKDPDLQRKQQALGQLIKDTAKAKGFDGAERMKQLSALQQRFKEEDLSLEEKQKLAAEFETLRAAMQKAQAEILQDDAVQKARGRFANELAAAMNTVDPTAESKIAELKSLAQDFRAKLTAEMQQHGSMMGH